MHAFKLSEGDITLLKSHIFEDNNGAISVATTKKMSSRTKHIGVKYLFVKQYFGDKKFQNHPFVLKKIDTNEQKADIFTKGLVAEKFLIMRKLLCNY